MIKLATGILGYVSQKKLVCIAPDGAFILRNIYVDILIIYSVKRNQVSLF